MGEALKDYNDDELAADLAKADLSCGEIAAKHGLSIHQIYNIAEGRSRPEIMAKVIAMTAGAEAEGRRLARSRGRFWVARLVQLANDPDHKVALDAVQTGLEACGLLNSDMNPEQKKQTIEIILTAKGSGDMLAKRFSGVYNGNGEPN